MIVAPLLAALIAASNLADAESKVLFDFTTEEVPETAQPADAELTHVERDGIPGLLVATGTTHRWPGVTLRAPAGHWDLSARAAVAMEVANLGEHRFEVRLRVDGVCPEGERASLTEPLTLDPGETGTLQVPLARPMPPEIRDRLFGMRGYPQGWSRDEGIHTERVDQLIAFVTQPAQEHRIHIRRVEAAGEAPPYLAMTAEEFFPMIDRFGLFMHADWPGKTHAEEDMQRAEEAELADLAAHPGPEDWNRFGGWEGGPQREATGFFRVEKYQDRWWLVDPEGRLFWSHGVNGVRSNTGATPLDGRRHLFSWLPEEGSPFAAFYGRRGPSPVGHYVDGPFETFNFTASNLLRKYGDSWQERFADRAHQRLRSWGMNTIGNWSDPGIYGMERTPYVATISFSSPPIEGSTGYWGKFPDPFHPAFEKTLRERMARERDRSAGDPWCLGYFIFNELSWGDQYSLSLAALRSPAEQPAKRAFVDDLMAKYETIDRLNAAWETDHASWEALLESQEAPEEEKAREDLGAFYDRLAEQFFRLCRDAVKEVAPDQLYLGVRFAWVNDRAIRASARYCGVVSFNRYAYDLSEFSLPAGIDVPVIIGEFHFGALDRGMFHTGLRPVADQDARAAAYRTYVESGLTHPNIVGTHWFIFGDQATTGRFDGENYQIGLVDLCDTPYPETIEAVRQVGHGMYRLRSEGKE